MRIRRSLPLVLAAAMLASAPGPAWAGPPKKQAPSDEAQDPDLVRARQLFYEGRKLFDLRRFDQALAKYEAAFEAKPLPEFLFNIGQCHRNLGNYDEAIFSFRRYLKLVPDDRRRPQIEALIAELQEKKKAAEDQARNQRLVPTPAPERPGHPPSRPVYKKWWFWTGIAVVAVAAGATTVALTRDGGGGLPTTDLGNVDFGK